jgi:hypothetical protein
MAAHDGNEQQRTAVLPSIRGQGLSLAVAGAVADFGVMLAVLSNSSQPSLGEFVRSLAEPLRGSLQFLDVKS